MVVNESSDISYPLLIIFFDTLSLSMTVLWGEKPARDQQRRGLDVSDWEETRTLLYFPAPCKHVGGGGALCLPELQGMDELIPSVTSLGKSLPARRKI